MTERPAPGPELTRVRPRPTSACISRGRSVLLTANDGLVENPDQGLFVHETRLLSRWRYFVGAEQPSPNAFSVVRQNRWLGYFVIAAPGVTPPPRDDGSGQVRDALASLLPRH